MEDHDVVLAALLEIRKRCPDQASYQAAVEDLAAELEDGDEEDEEDDGPA